MRVGPSVSEREAEQAKSGESGHSHLQVWLVGPAFVGEGEPGPSLSLSAEQGLATSTNLLVIETIITITANMGAYVVCGQHTWHMSNKFNSYLWFDLSLKQL
jgi:hypothetical protein